MNFADLGQQLFFSLLQTNYIAIDGRTDFLDLFPFILLPELLKGNIKVTLQATFLYMPGTQYFLHGLSE